MAVKRWWLALTLIGTAFGSGQSGFETRRLSAPLSFEPNVGQADAAFPFLSRGPGYALSLAPGQVLLTLERNTVGMRLIGANPQAAATGSAPQAGVVSYFMGNDPKQWRTAIPVYGKVDCPQVYPGVDLVFYGNQHRLEYDFVVAPGADPNRIAWRIDGVRPGVDREGNLTLSGPDGAAGFEKPEMYQWDGERKTPVEGSFAVAGDEVRFRVGPYDRSKTLIIDPVLKYATYLAGTDADYIGLATGPGILQAGTSQALAVDSSGSVYVTGYTYSSDFPTKSAYLSATPSKAGHWPAVFVTKFSPDGSSLVYSTYLGGNGSEYGFAIAVDSSGSAYVTGLTNSVNFPVTPGAYQTLCSPTPSNATSAASCNSSNESAFVTKLNPTGTGLVYSTFLGGYGVAYATAIAVDSTGRAYVAGNESQYCQTSYTFQGCFPTTAGAVIGGSSTGGRSPQYAFVSVFDSAGAKLLYSSLFGGLDFSCLNGCGDAWATGITVDANNYFYLIGETKAARLPTTAGAAQSTAGPQDSNNSYLLAHRGFVAKFNPVASAGGVSLAYSTYLGGHTGNTSDYLSGIAIDSSGNAYVAGYTNSADFPVTAGVYGTVCGPGGTCAAAHVTKLNPSGSAILWSTYVGGSRTDAADSLYFTGPIQLDGQGNVYFVGQTGLGFPLVNPVEANGAGGSMELAVVELDSTGSKLLFSTRIGSLGLDTGYPGGLAVDSAGNIYVAGNNGGPDLVTTTGAFQTASAKSPCCYHGFVAKIAPAAGPQITVRSSSVDVFNAATVQTGGIAPNEFFTIKGSGLGPATGAVSNMTTLLAGSRVSVAGMQAYLTYAQDGQINALAPFGISGLQTATIQAEYNGVQGNTVTVPVVASSPGIFTQSYGPGQAWIVNQDQTFNSSSNPAPRNSYVAFWVTGQGLVNTTVGDGIQPSGPPYPTPMLPVSVTLGGVAVPAANLAFDGLIYSGEVQINIQIPANAPTGSAVPLVVTIGGVSSRADATIAIQ